jgi:hypothetical protein
MGRRSAKKNKKRKDDCRRRGARAERGVRVYGHRTNQSEESEESKESEQREQRGTLVVFPHKTRAYRSSI